MRDSEKIKNEADDNKNILKPIIIVTVILLLIAGAFIWFGIKNPAVFSNVRDLTITLCALLMFILGIVITVLCIILTSRIKSAMIQIDDALSNADGKIEELGYKVTEILKKILIPIFNLKTNEAGIVNTFNTENKERN